MAVRKIAFPLWFFFLLLVFPTPSPAADRGILISVIDGDSLMIQIQGRSREVRLIGIDAPEWGQEYGTRAKAFSLKFCYGRPLTLEYDAERKDRFGRVLAYVYDDKKMLNEELVAAGLALARKYEPNTRHHDRLVKAQSLARKSRRGFWLHGGLKETPRQWRKRNKK